MVKYGIIIFKIIIGLIEMNVELSTIFQNYIEVTTISQNINLICQNVERTPEALYVERSDKEDENSPLLIKENNLLTYIFLRIKLFFDNDRASRAAQLHSVLEANVKALDRLPLKEYLDPKTHNFTELFLAAQRYNHLVHTWLLSDRDISLLDWLPPCSPIKLPEAAPIKAITNKIFQAPLEGIAQEQQPHVMEKEGLFGKHKVYHYNEADIHIDHGMEALRIFSNTQLERLMSLIGRVVETVAKVFGIEVTFFKEYHYFRNDEDQKGEIYAHDAPLTALHSSQATSYWIGHATCMLNVPIESSLDRGDITVNILTDPVEGDLNKLLYPRMTEPARSIDDCPMPHVITLSHNHLDHFDKDTLKKLVKYQPVVLVPEGDKEKFTTLGFLRVYENNWWQTTTIPIEQGDNKGELKITAVPANHWSGQGPCDGHHSAFVGYVIHKKEGDIYFAGDTARLSEDHITTLRNRFNIQTMFQPGGPDEARADMKSTHQASVDGLWMHFNLIVRNLYEKGDWGKKTKAEFIQEAIKLRTIYMHTKTFKLGNLHFDDTEQSIKRTKDCMNLDHEMEGKNWKDYEEAVIYELEAIGENLKFSDNDYIDWRDILVILDECVIVPKIGSRTLLG